MAETRQDVSQFKMQNLWSLKCFLVSTICVAGAGRGPLVARCLAAMKRANKDAFIYAVEKNPNAFVTYVPVTDTRLPHS